MNKSLPIQQNKLFSSYGGVESIIDTIDDISIKIEPFDKWQPLYQNVCNGRNSELLLDEPRLCSRVKSLGFENLTGFFMPDTSLSDEPAFNSNCPTRNEKSKMVPTTYFPTWFYCPKCHQFKPLGEWRTAWTIDGHFDDYAPACGHCSGVGRKRPKLQQTRFIMVSMETGEIADIPWKKVFVKRGISDSKNALVWKFDDYSPEAESVTYHVSDASTNLSRISVQNEKGEKVSLSDIFSHYIVIDVDGKSTVFRPAVKSDNNVYYAYNLNCIYIPQYIITQKDVDNIRQVYEEDRITNPSRIKRNQHLKCSEEDIQQIIDSGFTVPTPVYSSENQFRIEEFDFLTNKDNYTNGVYEDNEKNRLTSYDYSYAGSKPKFIKEIFYQTRLNVTTVQIAYSRIDKIGLDSLQYWKGKNPDPKKWYDVNRDTVTDVDVALRPTCASNIKDIEKMPALSSFGEGFLVALDLDYIPEEDRMTFMHTLCHLLMKEMEFVCGYPISSMSERLYYMPEQNKYGFMIYSVGGSSGSYGGISSLFESGSIEKIIENACLMAEDCQNDPICSTEGGHCFACVHIPETACEQFNQYLSRNVFNRYK